MENQHSPADQNGQAEASANVRHYWHVIIERRWLVITAFISIFVLSLIYLFNATPIYEATTRIQIDREQDSLLQKEAFSFTASQEEQIYLQTQYKNLMSRSLLQS